MSEPEELPNDEPAAKAIARWHRLIEGPREQMAEGLAELLADDVVFLSPVVFRPQEGKPVTTLYLVAAAHALSNEFRYVKEIVDGHHAVLEFECRIDGKHVNGIDLITTDDDGLITEFKVMVRPLQAVNAVHQVMMAQLGAFAAAAAEPAEPAEAEPATGGDPAD